MIKKYQIKSTLITAIKFEYSEEGIELLQEFCGDALISTSKERHINASGEAKIKSGCVFIPLKTIKEDISLKILKKNFIF